MDADHLRAEAGTDDGAQLSGSGRRHSETSDPVTRGRPKDSRTVLRRAAAVMVIMAGAAAAVGSNWWDALEVCRTVTGGQPLAGIGVCDPWGIGELVPFVLVGVLLLLPDMSELSIANLVTLKRQVEAQKHELDATSARQAALEQQVITQVASVRAQQTSTNNFYIGSAARVLAEIDRKEEYFTESPSGHQMMSKSSVVTPSAEPSTEVSLLSMELIRIWERLRPFVAGISGQAPDLADLGVEQTQVIQHWNTVFQDEIEFVRAARNGVAHGRVIGEEDLRVVVQAATHLEELLQDMARLPEPL